MIAATGICLLLLLTTSVLAQPPVTALAYAPHAQQLLVGSQAGIDVREGPQLEARRRIVLDMPHVHDFAFSPQGQRFAVCGGRPGEYGEVAVCGWPSGEIVWRRIVHDDLVYRVCWNASGSELATASADQRVMTLTSDTGKILQTLQGHTRPVLAVCFLPGPSRLVSAGVDRSLRVWDTAEARTLRQLDNHTDEIRALALRPATEGLPILVTVGADRTVRFWQPTIGRLIRFVKLPATPLSVAWLPNGQHVVVGCVDGHIRLVDFESLSVDADHPAIDGWVYEVAVADNGRWIAAAGSQGELVQIPVADLLGPAALQAATSVAPSLAD